MMNSNSVKDPKGPLHNGAISILMYTGSLALADFSGGVFTCAHFQNIAQISSFCHFHYMSEGIPSLMRFWLRTNGLSDDLVDADFCRT